MSFAEQAKRRRDGDTTLGIPAARLPGVLRDALLERLTLGVLTDGDLGVVLPIAEQRQLLQHLLSRQADGEDHNGGELDEDAFREAVRRVYGTNWNPATKRD